ncbi:MAG: hypothetical protein NVS2B15_26370 [Pseudarthrobacter sp.]
MDKPEAGTTVRRESILEVRVDLVHSEPAIWRQLEMSGSLALNQVHQVLQAAFGWEDVHLHRFTPDDPFGPLRPVDGEYPEALQWLPGQECEEPEDSPEEDCTLEQLFSLGPARASRHCLRKLCGLRTVPVEDGNNTSSGLGCSAAFLRRSLHGKRWQHHRAEAAFVFGWSCR